MTEKVEYPHNIDGNHLIKDGVDTSSAPEKVPFYMEKKLSFKPIQDQIKEERFKRPVQVKKQSQVDGDLMLALNSHESMFNDGDFDYFQYFGQKKNEEEKWKQMQEDDVMNFKKSRENLVVTEKDKAKGIYVLKENKVQQPAQEKNKIKIGIKIKKKADIDDTQSQSSNLDDNKNSESGSKNPVNKADQPINNNDEDSDDYDIGILNIRKKVKKEN